MVSILTNKLQLTKYHYLSNVIILRGMFTIMIEFTNVVAIIIINIVKNIEISK